MKRPGAEYFLREMANYFELVIYTASLSKVSLYSLTHFSMLTLLWTWWTLIGTAQSVYSESTASLWTVFLWRTCHNLAVIWKMQWSLTTRRHRICCSLNAAFLSYLGTTICQTVLSMIIFHFWLNSQRLMTCVRLSLALCTTTRSKLTTLLMCAWASKKPKKWQSDREKLRWLVSVKHNSQARHLKLSAATLHRLTSLLSRTKLLVRIRSQTVTSKAKSSGTLTLSSADPRSRPIHKLQINQSHKQNWIRKSPWLTPGSKRARKANPRQSNGPPKTNHKLGQKMLKRLRQTLRRAKCSWC